MTPPFVLIDFDWATPHQVIDAFLPRAAGLLAPGGRLYLVGIADNDPKELVAIMRDRYGLAGSVLRYEQRGIETLFVLRCIKPRDQVLQCLTEFI